MKREVLVIGGGVSGMTAALILARHGLDVSLVERFPKLGQVIRGFSMQGVHFDTGMHYTGFLGRGEPLDTYFRYLGLGQGLARIPFDPRGYDRLLMTDAGFCFDLPYGRERIEAAFGEVFPAEIQGVRTFLGQVREVCETSPLLNPQRPLPPDPLAGASARQGLLEVMAPLIRDPRLRTLLSLHCLHMGCEPEQTLFADFARVAGSFHASAHTVEGGGEGLARAFEQALADAGVEVHLQAEVAAICCGPDGSAQSVRLSDNRELPAGAVIYTGHPGALPAMVPERLLRPAYRGRLARLADTPSAYMLFGAAAERLELLDRRNIIILPERNGERVFRSYGVKEERPLFVSMDQSASRTGRRGVIVLAAGDYAEVAPWAGSRAGERPPAYAEHKAAVAMTVQAQLAAACPELSGRIDFLACATPLTFARRLRAPRGGLYGVSHNMEQATPLPMTKVPGLFLAGQAVVSPGLLGAMVSAFLACGFVVGHETLRQGLAECVENGW